MQTIEDKVYKTNAMLEKVSLVNRADLQRIVKENIYSHLSFEGLSGGKLMNIYFAGINVIDEQRQIMERAGTGHTEFNFIGILIILAIVLFLFWLWMLVDCLKRQDDKFAAGGNNARLIWVLVIILTGIIGG